MEALSKFRTVLFLWTGTITPAPSPQPVYFRFSPVSRLNVQSPGYDTSKSRLSDDATCHTGV